MLADEEVYVGEGEEKDDEEDSDGEFFNAGEGAAINEQVSSRTAAKSGQTESDAEEDPVRPTAPGPNTTMYDEQRTQ
jgi:hypothetical protein